MKVLSIENIKIVGKNQKYYKNFALTNEYRNFKKEIEYCIVKPSEKILRPYRVTIEFTMYHDIDAPVQTILDALESAGIIDNDRYITELNIVKNTTKRGKPGAVECWVHGH